MRYACPRACDPGEVRASQDGQRGVERKAARLPNHTLLTIERIDGTHWPLGELAISLAATPSHAERSMPCYGRTAQLTGNLGWMNAKPSLVRTNASVAMMMSIWELGFVKST